MIDRINQVSEEQNELIKNVLSMTSIETLQATLPKENLNVKALTLEIVRNFELIASKKGIKIIVNLSDNEIMLNANRYGVVQVLENLLSNAIKFSKSGDEVKVELRSDTSKITLAISDTGPGFNETDLELIYQPFNRLTAQPTAGEASSGLGLSIVKGYLEAMDATINLKTSVGKGSTFTITFPHQNL